MSLNENQTPNSRQREIMRDRYRGCLLGGAVGDALGYPIEFEKEDTIQKQYGPQGIQTLSQAGRPACISDDTQMTLFAANGIVYAREQHMDLRESLWLAYREWLGTQGDTRRMEDPVHPKMWVYRDKRLHVRRAPGNSCLYAIGTSQRGGTTEYPVNQSKGCGTVMRAAPFGLAVSALGDGAMAVHKMAVCDAALTHGHVLAWASSSMLAQMIFRIVQEHPQRDIPLQDAILSVGYPGDHTLDALLRRAVRLSLDPTVSDLDGIHALGEGWVAEEALAIAVFCAVRYQNDFASAIRAAVNHKGDSDSTGAICGNLLGAWLGNTAVKAAFDLENLELRDVIEKMADQLLDMVEAEGGAASQAEVSKTSGTQAPFSLRPVGLRYTPLTKRALAICFEAHKQQTDKSGLPYVFHPFHLAEQMETEEEICTALLHDVVEDSHYTIEDLRQAGFPQTVLEALRLLTHDPSVDYLHYVARIKENPIARRVKLADLRHNSDLSRLEIVSEQDRQRVEKYRMAEAILQGESGDASLHRFCAKR